MLRNRELVGHAVGGAAIGVAVGMAIQKMVSPRAMQHSPIITGGGSSCKCVNKRSRSKNLQIPLHHHKDHRNRHSRSKSACEGLKHSKNEGDLSDSTKSSTKWDLSSSKKDLRSRPENSTKVSKNYENYKVIDNSELSSSITERRLTSNDYKNIPKNDEKSKIAKKLSDRSEFILNSSTEYLPIKGNTSKDTPVSLLFDKNNRQSHVNFSNDAFSENGLDDFNSVEATCDSVKKDTDFSSYRESSLTISTEYFPVVSKKHIQNFKSIIPIFDEKNRDFILTDNLANDDKTNNNVISTCSKNSDEQKFVTLPNSSDMIHSSTENDVEF